MEPFFPLSRNVVHACDFTGVQSHTDQKYIAIVCSVFSLNIIVVVVFVSQKLHFNIKIY